jgi:DNA-binding Lrp family transcriptional regulator
MTHIDQPVDQLDVAILDLLRSESRIGVLEMARRLEVARGTVQARIDKMVTRGVVTGFGPELDTHALGCGVTAFTTISVAQGRISEVVEPLLDIPEVLEAHSIAGEGDLLLRIVARSNEDLMDILERILSSELIARSSTAIALATQIPYRTMPLARALVGSAPT